MKQINRIPFLDGLRVCATLAVVLLHIVSGARDHLTLELYSFENRFSTLVLDFVSWGVPVFLMISGYLFLDPKREITYKNIVTKYCLRIVLALLLFGVPFAGMELVATRKCIRLSMLWEAVLMVLRGESWAHLWYLYLTIGLYMITPVLRYCLSRVPQWCVWLTCGGLLLFGSVFPFAKIVWNLDILPVMPDFFIYLFYYLCGYLFCSSGEKQSRGGFFIFTGIVVLAFMIAFCTRLSCNIMLQTAYAYPTTVMLSLGIFGIGATGARKKNTGISGKISVLCFAVYLIHPVFINILYKFFGVTPYDYNLWWSVPVCFVAVLMASVVGACLLRLIGPLRRWVL